ncbi:cyanoexosortase A [Nostoc sp. TCL26-01]|uniref:cyanoexosortase A n=1 Tax=Nostoc sp. TCL26-01 TaxID=2576904 RepID=UPI0015B8600F|nr:cyanoexosortase A [Nostoc sp. TCL26-01]QLE58192.1 cyanoexosortase A [Nostoc sp. TCL26-01]
MKSLQTNCNAVKKFDTIKTNQFWLLGIASSLIAIHLSLTSRQDGNLFALSILFWLATSFFVWQKRHSLNLESSLYSSIFGFIIIAIILLRSLAAPSWSFLGLFPLISGLGFSLIASGFKGLIQYRQELILLFFFKIPHILLTPIIDISALTAKFATYILWYLGFEASVQGFNVVLPQGSVLVYSPCAGFDGILDLIRLSVVFLILFPLQGIKKRIFVLVSSMVIAFVTNGFRVALMAILTAAQNQQAFEYWHTGKGSLIFSMISTAIFGAFYYLLLLQENATTKILNPKTLDGEHQ